VNTAAAGEIEKGLGLATNEAAAIVEYRAKNGNFKTLDDLKKVDGVDAKKLDAAKDRMAF
jgi:competence protein ComEA